MEEERTDTGGVAGEEEFPFAGVPINDSEVAEQAVEAADAVAVQEGCAMSFRGGLGCWDFIETSVQGEDAAAGSRLKGGQGMDEVNDGDSSGKLLPDPAMRGEPGGYHGGAHMVQLREPKGR